MKTTNEFGRWYANFIGEMLKKYPPPQKIPTFEKLYEAYKLGYKEGEQDMMRELERISQ